MFAYLRKTVRALVFLIVLVRHAPAAGGGRDIRDPGPDFGDFPNSAYTVPRGSAYVETALVRITASDPGAAFNSVPILVRLGLTDHWELRLAAAVGTVRENGDASTGVSALGVGFKVNLVKENLARHRPSVGIEGLAILPVGTGPFETVKAQPLLAVNVGHPLTDELLFGWNLQVSTPQGVDGDRFLETQLEWTFVLTAARTIDIALNGQVAYPANENGGVQNQIALGLQAYLREWIVFTSNFAVGLTSETPDSYYQVGITIAF